MNIKSALKKITAKQNLTTDEMSSVMHSIMTGQATTAQIGGFLVGLRMKGETIEEITGAVKVMRELVTPVAINGKYIVDIVGTGGDGSNTFNISTASALVVAAAGGNVAKHGNRSVSSKSGSADALEALGVKIDLTPTAVAECVDKIGIGFMFAPLHHSAMKHAIGPRKEMGIRTIFNLLGPLTNPANTPNQVVGVFSQDWLEPIAQVLKRLGSQHVLIVHSEDGLDEISIAAPTSIVELNHGEITSYTVTPEQFGLNRASLEQIRVESVEQSISMLQSVFNNQATAARDIVVLNAGAAIYTAGLTNSFAEGVITAQNTLSSGAVNEKLTAWIELSQSL
ncbi:MAG: anthranilate phosphoribosyltransferase [Thiomargarita sp.]|nr:anthranilate phosphoribosyltransferase [Thiomargarita sp.]